VQAQPEPDAAPTSLLTPGELKTDSRFCTVLLRHFGQAIFSLADSTETIGNEIERAVKWKKGSDVSSLSGKVVRLRFVMKDARLYALQFRS